MYYRSLFLERSTAKCIFNEDIPRLADNFPLFTRRVSELIKWVVLLFIYIYICICVCVCICVYIPVVQKAKASAMGKGRHSLSQGGRDVVGGLALTRKVCSLHLPWVCVLFPLSGAAR